MARRKKEQEEVFEAQMIIIPEEENTKIVHLTAKEAERLAVEHDEFRFRALDALYRLFVGHGVEVLHGGYASWEDMCKVEFGYEKSAAYRLVHIARVHYETKPLLTNGQAVITLEDMPDKGIEHLTKLSPKVRADIIEELSHLDHIPSELDTLIAIPTQMLSQQQVNRIIAIRKSTDGRTWMEQRDSYVTSIINAVEKLFKLYADDDNNVDGFYQIVREKLPQLRRAWLYEDEYGHIEQEQFEPDYNADEDTNSVQEELDLTE